MPRLRYYAENDSAVSLTASCHVHTQLGTADALTHFHSTARTAAGAGESAPETEEPAATAAASRPWLEVKRGGANSIDHKYGGASYVSCLRALPRAQRNLQRHTHTHARHVPILHSSAASQFAAKMKQAGAPKANPLLKPKSAPASNPLLKQPGSAPASKPPPPSKPTVPAPSRRIGSPPRRDRSPPRRRDRSPPRGGSRSRPGTSNSRRRRRSRSR